MEENNRKMIVGGRADTHAEFVISLHKAFAGENVIYDRRIGRHTVNLFFPDYLLAICCIDATDENFQWCVETEREYEIEQIHGFEYWRFDHTEEDVFQVISYIHKYIIKHISRTKNNPDAIQDLDSPV